MDRRRAELRRLRGELHRLQVELLAESDGRKRGRLNVKILEVNRQIIRWSK